MGFRVDITAFGVVIEGCLGTATLVWDQDFTLEDTSRAAERKHGRRATGNTLSLGSRARGLSFKGSWFPVGCTVRVAGSRMFMYTYLRKLKRRPFLLHSGGVITPIFARATSPRSSTPCTRSFQS